MAKEKNLTDDLNLSEEELASSTDKLEPAPAPVNETPIDITPIDEDDEESNASKESEGLTEEEAALLQKLLNKTQFYAHNEVRAKKSVYKEMFRSEHIITDSPDAPIKTEATMLREDLEELNASAAAKRILSGKIVGLRTANPDSKVATMLAEVVFGNGTCTVLIPSYLLYDYDVENEKYRDASEQQKIAQRCSDMIGSIIHFVVRQVDVGNKTAYADRMQAMDMEAYANYTRPTSDGKPRVVPGQIVQARVVRVTYKSITLYALGSETTLKMNRDENEVTWSFTPNLREQFKVNDRVNVKILEVKPRTVKKYASNYTLVDCKMSIKQTSMNPMDKYFDNIVESGIYAATVTAKVSGGVFVKLKDQIDCLVAHPQYGELPKVGDQKVVRVTEKVVEDNGNKKIFGIFVS